MKQETLDDKRVLDEVGLGLESWIYFEEDVKDFIQKLKEGKGLGEDKFYEEQIEFINKLAGEKLTK